MIEEIIYTSAPRGLRRGSSGFCTVVSTQGMSRTLAERLENLSPYRHAFPINDPRNPVNHSHLTMRVAGEQLHVLSRIADAGPDHTGRSNKIAHHLVLKAAGTQTSGPARVLGGSGVVCTEWDGATKLVPARTLKTVSTPAVVRLTHWERLTGDHGWAGYVAEQLLDDPAPLSVIFDPQTDTLGLVQEIIDLVPPSRRWSITFSTYFVRPMPGTQCQLRFVLNETSEATTLRNDVAARVLDLTHPLPPAAGGALVDVARSGRVEQLTTPALPSRQAGVDSETEPQAPTDDGDDGGAYALQGATGRSAAPELPHRRKQRLSDEHDDLDRTNALWPVATAAVVLVLGLAALGLYFGVFRGDEPGQVARTDPATGGESPTRSTREDRSQDSRESHDRGAPETTSRSGTEDASDPGNDPANTQTVNDTASTDPDSADVATSSPAEAGTATPPVTPGDATADTTKPSAPTDVFGQKLPASPYLLDMKWQATAGEAPLVTSDIDQVVLAVPLKEFEVSKEDDEWHLMYRHSQAPNDPVKLCVLSVTEAPDALRFAWNPDSSEKPLAELLRLYPLEIQGRTANGTLHLRQTNRHKAETLAELEKSAAFEIAWRLPDDIPWGLLTEQKISLIAYITVHTANGQALIQEAVDLQAKPRPARIRLPIGESTPWPPEKAPDASFDEITVSGELTRADDGTREFAIRIGTRTFPRLMAQDSRRSVYRNTTLRADEADSFAGLPAVDPATGTSYATPVTRFEQFVTRANPLIFEGWSGGFPVAEVEEAAKDTNDKVARSLTFIANRITDRKKELTRLEGAVKNKPNNAQLRKRRDNTGQIITWLGEIEKELEKIRAAATDSQSLLTQKIDAHRQFLAGCRLTVSIHVGTGRKSLPLLEVE